MRECLARAHDRKRDHERLQLRCKDLFSLWEYEPIWHRSRDVTDQDASASLPTRKLEFPSGKQHDASQDRTLLSLRSESIQRSGMAMRGLHSSGAHPTGCCRIASSTAVSGSGIIGILGFRMTAGTKLEGAQSWSYCCVTLFLSLEHLWRPTADLRQLEAQSAQCSACERSYATDPFGVTCPYCSSTCSCSAMWDRQSAMWDRKSSKNRVQISKVVPPPRPDRRMIYDTKGRQFYYFLKSSGGSQVPFDHASSCVAVAMEGCCAELQLGRPTCDGATTALAGFALQQNFEKQGGKEGKVKTAMDKMPVSD